MKWTVGVVAALLLFACGSAEGSEEGPGHFDTTTIEVDDREISCVTWYFGNAGGLSCDWSAR